MHQSSVWLLNNRLDGYIELDSMRLQTMHHVLGISEAVEKALGRLQHTIRLSKSMARSRQ